MSMWKKWLAISLMLCGLSMGAQAQRMAVPVVDFVNVPVATHAGRVLDAGQVYQAIATAAAAERWDLVKVRDGVVHAAFRRGDQHRRDRPQAGLAAQLRPGSPQQRVGGRRLRRKLHRRRLSPQRPRPSRPAGESRS